MDFVVDSGVKGLKTELEEKTGVPADRMKLMAKSKGMFQYHTYSIRIDRLTVGMDRSLCLCLTPLLSIRSLEGGVEG